MSIFSMCRFIIFVTSQEKPGIAPIHVGMCRPGFPTVATLIFSRRSLRIASSPKNVKKRSASMPSMRAPLAMISPG
jgi:hypothetical protein